ALRESGGGRRTLEGRAAAPALRRASGRRQEVDPSGWVPRGGIFLGRGRFAGGRAPDPRPLSGAGRAGGVRARRPARGAQGAAGDGEVIAGSLWSSTSNTACSCFRKRSSP